MPDFIQPGEPDQLAKTVEAAEKYYEDSVNRINAPVLVVYWENSWKRYRIGRLSQVKYKPEDIEVLRIP